jgi:hypothetical protein
MLQQELHCLNIASGCCFTHWVVVQARAGSIRAAGDEQLQHTQLAGSHRFENSCAHCLCCDACMLGQKVAQFHMPIACSQLKSNLQRCTHTTALVMLVAAPLQ